MVNKDFDSIKMHGTTVTVPICKVQLWKLGIVKLCDSGRSFHSTRRARASN